MTILSQAVWGMVVFFTLTASTGFGVEAKEPPTLETLLRNALQNNGKIAESVQEIEAARAQLEQARAASYPQVQALILGAPMIEQRGDALNSTMNWNHWGPFVQGSMQIIQPIYTFGQIDSYQRAAGGQLTAKSELADVRRNEIVYSTKEFYYSYLMASELQQLVDDTVKFLEEASETAEKNIQDEDAKSNIKPHDLYKLKNALEDLRQKQLYARQGRQTAQKAIAWISVTNFQELKDKNLNPEIFEKKELEYYLKLARAKRPEFRALAAGQEARAALRDAKRAQSYPAIFIGAFGSAGWSPVTDKQNSMFANDPYNRITGGAGMGIKFDLDIWKHEAEAHEQEAELMKLKATESWAAPGIELEVKKAFWELEQWFDGLEVAKRRKDLTKKWFVSSAMGWSVGLTAAKDLLEALEGNAIAKKNYIETVFSLNMALAKLSQSVGEELAGLKYRN